MPGESVMADAVEAGEGADSGGASVLGGAARADAVGGDHEVFRSVFRGDELEDFRAIPGPFEELGAQHVGDDLRLEFLETPMAKRFGQNDGSGELRAKFLLAARGDDEELRAGGEATGEGVVRGGVAGMQRDQEVDVRERGVRDRAGGERQTAGETVARGGGVAGGDEVGAGFESEDAAAFAQQFGDGEGEVTFATAHIDDGERLVRGGGKRVGDEVLQQLREFLDLAEFVGHAVAGLSAIVGHAEGVEPRGVGGDEIVLRVIVGRGGGRDRGGGWG